MRGMTRKRVRRQCSRLRVRRHGLRVIGQTKKRTTPRAVASHPGVVDHSSHGGVAGDSSQRRPGRSEFSTVGGGDGLSPAEPSTLWQLSVDGWVVLSEWVGCAERISASPTLQKPRPERLQGSPRRTRPRAANEPGSPRPAFAPSRIANPRRTEDQVPISLTKRPRWRVAWHGSPEPFDRPPNRP
jgi:hypothetical protein